MLEKANEDDDENKQENKQELESIEDMFNSVDIDIKDRLSGEKIDDIMKYIDVNIRYNYNMELESTRNKSFWFARISSSHRKYKFNRDWIIGQKASSELIEDNMILKHGLCMEYAFRSNTRHYWIFDGINDEFIEIDQDDMYDISKEYLDQRHKPIKIKGNYKNKESLSDNDEILNINVEDNTVDDEDLEKIKLDNWDESLQENLTSYQPTFGKTDYIAESLENTKDIEQNNDEDEPLYLYPAIHKYRDPVTSYDIKSKVLYPSKMDLYMNDVEKEKYEALLKELGESDDYPKLPEKWENIKTQKIKINDNGSDKLDQFIPNSRLSFIRDEEYYNNENQELETRDARKIMKEYSGVINNLNLVPKKFQKKKKIAKEKGVKIYLGCDGSQCNDPSKECSYDIIRYYISPSGDIETKRTHTY